LSRNERGRFGALKTNKQKNKKTKQKTKKTKQKQSKNKATNNFEIVK
jgi:hypothetical protein